MESWHANCLSCLATRKEERMDFENTRKAVSQVINALKDNSYVQEFKVRVGDDEVRMKRIGKVWEVQQG